MHHEFEFSFDVAFIKAAMRRDILWKGYVIAGLMLALPLFTRLISGAWDLWVLGVALVGAVVIIWRFCSLLNKLGKRVFELWTLQSPSGKIQYQLDDEGFVVIAGESRSRFEWQGLRRLWRYDDAWLVEIVKMQSVFFPPDQAPVAAREFMVERCRHAGVRV